MIQMELLVWNEYVHMHLNSCFEIDIILNMFSFDKEISLKHSICQNVLEGCRESFETFATKDLSFFP